MFLKWCIYLTLLVDVDDLCGELEDRGYKVIDSDQISDSCYTIDGEELNSLITEIYYAYMSKKPIDNLLVDFFDKSIGRIA